MRCERRGKAQRQSHVTIVPPDAPKSQICDTKNETGARFKAEAAVGGFEGQSQPTLIMLFLITEPWY